tara:strand:+ start:1220 stop:1774 length:555 start_codon:yes stop_codon:yes gene_type:complete
MNSFYTKQEIASFKFKSVGNNVLISRKASIFSPENISIGNNVRIDDFCLLSGKITLQSYIHISAYCALYGKHEIEMESFTGLSPRCTLFSATDDFGGDFLISPMTNPKHNNIIKGKILIKKYSQIGTDTIILPNITIEEGTAIGAKSLVNKSTKPWGIYFGQPITKHKNRKKGILDLIKHYDVP